LRSFDEVKFEEPGYPVFKVFFVPYRDEDRVVSTRKVTPQDVEIWKNVLRRLKEFLSEALEFAKRMREGNLNQTEELELLADLIALFLRVPLIRETIPAVMPNPLKTYLLYRLIGFEKIQDETRSPVRFIELTYREDIVKRLNELKPIAILSDADLSEKIEHCWFALPADTRPPLNTSGLLPHLLLASAIAWAKATANGLPRKETAMLRLAAMLRDMGKPFRYTDPVTASSEIAEILLEGKSYVSEIKEIQSREAQMLSEADDAATFFDGLISLGGTIIGERIRNLSNKAGINEDAAYRAGPECWEFWKKLHQYDNASIDDLSRMFVEEIRKRAENYTKPVEMAGGRIVDGVEMALIDVGNIQSFVFRSEELRVVVAASLMIDAAVMAQIPSMIQHHVSRDVWLPYEAIIYSAGGVIQLILPSNLVGTLEKACEEIKEISVRFASVPLSTNYRETTQNLTEKIQFKKFSMKPEDRFVKTSPGKGVRNLCKLCYLNPPEEKVLTPEGEKEVCGTCKKLYEIGGDLHFRVKYESEIIVKNRTFVPRQVFHADWDGASKWIVELIAGHNKEELEGKIRLRNLGIMKVDGNLMGVFMATCLSAADAYERSARIDLALKKAIEYSVEKIWEGVQNISKNDDEAARAAVSVKLGLLYAGGDDALFFMPSWGILPFALVLGREFSANMGGARGLSMGLVSSPARASVWAIVSAASMLMGKAKAEARKNPSLSLFCFDAVDSGTLSDSSAEARFDLLKEQFLSSQPYGVEDLFRIVINGYSSDAEAFGKCYALSRFPELCGNGFKESVKKEQDRVKGIRSAIGSSLSVARSRVKSNSYIPIVARLYGIRQATRMGSSSPYAEILKLTPQKVGESSCLIDADRMIKIVGGGAI
jgi:hypothetical protein